MFPVAAILVTRTRLLFLPQLSSEDTTTSHYTASDSSLIHTCTHIIVYIHSYIYSPRNRPLIILFSMPIGKGPRAFLLQDIVASSSMPSASPVLSFYSRAAASTHGHKFAILYRVRIVTRMICRAALDYCQYIVPLIRVSPAFPSQLLWLCDTLGCFLDCMSPIWISEVYYVIGSDSLHFIGGSK